MGCLQHVPQMDSLALGWLDQLLTALTAYWPYFVPAIPSIPLIFDVIKPSYGLVHFIQKRRKLLPNIVAEEPDSLEEYIYHRGNGQRMYKQYSCRMVITNKWLGSNATNCQGRIRFKPSQGQEDVRERLAWQLSDNPPMHTLEQGDPKNLRLFMFNGQEAGIALCNPQEQEGYHCSQIPRGLYDYIRLEMYCTEWKGYKTLKEWRNSEFPKCLESLPVKRWSVRPSDQEWYDRYESFRRRLKQSQNLDILDKLADLDHELTDLIRGSTKMSFPDGVTKYSLLETEAESLVGVDHDEFYVNPELLEGSETNSAYLVDLASKLLRKVKERRQKIRNE
jgi:hypothetical protein